MTRKELTVYIAAILTTLAEGHGAPESHLYIAVGMDIHNWEIVRGVLTDRKWVSISGHWVKITDEGRAMADRVTAAQTA